MNIAVCFKITDDYDALTPEEWSAFAAQDAPDISYVRRILGCYDEAALENALLLKDQLTAAGIPVGVAAYTVNPGYSDHILRSLPAIGIDAVYTLRTETCLDFFPAETARILAEAIRKTGMPDLVLTGSQTPPGNSGTVPGFLAAELQLPLYDQFVSLRWEKERLIVKTETPDAYAEYFLRVPALCIAGNTERSYLRVASLIEKLKYREFRPAVLDMESTENPPHITKTYTPATRTCRMISCSEMAARIRDASLPSQTQTQAHGGPV